jgi:hypothetical protein
MRKLLESIKFYNKYVKGKHFSEEKLQNVLSDILFRYINFWEYKSNKGKISMINCIKGYNKEKKLKIKYNELIKEIILPSINETNKLLLKKSIYYDFIYN